MEKEYYNAGTVKEKFGVLANNFILYKTLLGDNSDKIPGVKGLGVKGIFKKFPELKTHNLTLEDIFDISTRKFKEHVELNFSTNCLDNTAITSSASTLSNAIVFIGNNFKY